MLIASTGQAEKHDILDPGYDYSSHQTMQDDIRDIRNGVKTGVEYAKEFKKDISNIKDDQLELSRRSLENSYEIKLLSLKQGVIKKKVEELEIQGQKARELLDLLSRGVEKSLRFVSGAYTAIGLLAGIIGTVLGGVIVIYIKKYLIKKKRLD